MIQSDPETEPKRSQKPPKLTLLDLTKHMVFPVRITHWADSVDLWEHVFSALLSGRCFFLGFVRLLRFWVPKGCPKGVVYSCGEWAKIDSVAKSLPGSPEAPKGCPEIPKCHQKRPQIDDFATHKSRKWAESFVVSDNLQTAQRLGLEKKCEHSPLFGKTLWGEISR